jgi:RNA polymerase sigma-70 factor (ECF subfamily)
MLGNESDALDATQDALLAAIRGLKRFDGRSSFATWLYRIATNTCIDEMRRRRRRPVTGIAADVAEVADEVSFGAPGLFVLPTGEGGHRFEEPVDAADVWQDAGGAAGASGPGSHRPGARGKVVGSDRGAAWGRDPAEVVARRVDVDVALASLPVEFRTAVVLRDVCDLPYDEIAEILHVPVGTVRSRIARARSALATTWGAERESPLGRDGAEHDASGNRPRTPDVKADERDWTAETGTSTRQEHRRQPEPTTAQSQQEERTP